MSQHIKSLFQQLQPLFHSSTQYNTPKSKKSSPERPIEQLADSGLDTSKSLYSSKKQAQTKRLNTTTCKQCLFKLSQSSEISKKLKQSHINFVKSGLNEAHFANIPMLVARSYRPSIDSANKLQVKKGTAVNALYMIDNKWIFVKTLNEQKGFIPKKCCEPFSLDRLTRCSHQISLKSRTKLARRFECPKIRAPALPSARSECHDHTYMTIDHKINSSDNTTGISLFSVSRCDSKPKTVKNQKEVIKKLSESKSRNRKLSIAFDLKMQQAVSLTMLEQVEEAKSEKLYVNEQDLYESLSSFESLRKSEDSDNNQYDFLSSLSESASKNLIVNYSESEMVESEYDILMTYSNTPCSNSASNANSSKNYYNLLSEKKLNSKSLRLYKVVADYKSSSKSGFSVCKGDLVYLVKNSLRDSEEQSEKGLVFARLYKRSRSGTNKKGLVYENLVEQSSGLLQGYLPKACLAKLNGNSNNFSNQNSPIYC